MTSCFDVMRPVGQNQRQRCVWSSSPDDSSESEVGVDDCMVVVSVFVLFGSIPISVCFLSSYLPIDVDRN